MSADRGRKRRRLLPKLTAEAFSGSSVVDGSTPFTATSALSNDGTARDRRHARGNWPSHIGIVLRGPSSLFGGVVRGHGVDNTDEEGDNDDDESLNEDVDDDEVEEAETLVRLARSASTEARSVLATVAPGATVTDYFPAARIGEGDRGGGRGSRPRRGGLTSAWLARSHFASTRSSPS